MKTETKFSINNNEKMFKILSSQLYTNKPLAIVRELSCNALDAHLSIKQQSPFIVTLKDTSIAFIDYGPGLSNDQMMEIYPAYGESPKEDNQEQIGGLGLGSKSPFSYTDEFLVISTQNYISNTYIARIEAGYPTLKLIHTEPNPSVEHGLMITIEIDPKDKRDFELSISNVLMYFPENSYQTETYVAKRKYSIKPNEDFGILDATSTMFNKIVMGPVAYTLQNSKLPNKLYIEHQLLLDIVGLELYTPIDSVEVAASRETLSYSDATVKTLSNLLAKVTNTIVEKVTEDLNKHPDYYSAQCALATLTTGLKNIVKKENIQWHNRTIASSTTVNSLLNSKKCFAKFTDKVLRRSALKLDWENSLEIKPINFSYKKPAIIFKDSYKIPFNKTVWYSKKSIKQNTLICRGDLFDLYALCKAFDIAPDTKGSLENGGVVNLSDLPREPKVTHISSKSGKTVTRIKKSEQKLEYALYPGYPYIYDTSETKEFAFKDKDAATHTYVFTDRGSIENLLSPEANKTLIRFCKAYGNEQVKKLTEFTTIAIPKTHANVVKDNTIVHLNTRMDQLVTSMHNEDVFDQLIGYGTANFSIENREATKKFMLAMLSPRDNAKTSLETKYIKLIHFLKKYNQYLSIIYHLNIPTTSKSQAYKKQIETLSSEFIKKYPLINMLSEKSVNNVSILQLEDYFRDKNKMPSASSIE